ncbi:MAG: hypothetical protein KatS3mg115_2316 [Candidatus Poribacteria bacterium]|nr:MAG: hypothetical protein KatS3mg115_2316 [Candidatus Poribacteria bacterium]
MKRARWVIGIGLAGAMLGATFWVAQRSSAQAQEERVQRGKYLVETVAACGQCHTPRRGAEEDLSRLLSGHPEGAPAPRFAMELIQQGVFISIAPTYTAFSGPWGTSYATNLTPDPETGLGSWTEEQFVRAMRTGRHQGQPNARTILPPMPWKAYQGMSEEDLRAIWAYLQTIPPIRNRVPPATNRFGEPYDQ